MENRINTGTHIIILKDSQVLLGKRKKEFGQGQWELPGGHLEFQETFEENLERECQEELGIKVKVGKLISIAPNMVYGNHYIIFTFLADSYSGKPKLKEPDKHESWSWFSLDNLPEKLFISTKLALEDFQNGKVYQKRKVRRNKV